MAHIEQDGQVIGRVDLADPPAPDKIETDPALDLVMTDAANAVAWIQGQQWNECWRVTDMLYDSPRTFATWDSGTLQPQVQRYTLAEHVNSIHPQMMEGLFYGPECFSFEPRPGTDSDIARARSSVIKVELDQMDFEQEASNGIFQLILHGTGIWKWGLETTEEIEYEYIRKSPKPRQTDAMGQEISADTPESDEYEEKENRRTVTKPFLIHRENREVLVDPKLKHWDIRRAGYVIEKNYMTLNQLLDLR